MALVSEITFIKSSGKELELSLSWLDEQGDSLAEASDKKYIPEIGVHLVRLTPTQLLIFDNIDINRKLLNGFKISKNDADSTFGISCQAIGVSPPAAQIGLRDALATFYYKNFVASLASIYCQLVTIPAYLAATHPSIDMQLLTPYQMWAHLAWNSFGGPAAPYNIAGATATNIPYNQILQARNFFTTHLISETQSGVLQYGVILITKPGVYLLNGRWTTSSSVTTSLQPFTQITVNNVTKASLEGWNPTGGTFTFAQLITQNEIDANADNAARLEVQGFVSGTTTNFPLNPASQSSWLQIALLG